MRFPCPYLHADVELTEEREMHIAERHPEMLPGGRELLAGALAKPDQVRKSRRFAQARLLSRWYPEFQGGKFVVVVVVHDLGPPVRHWIVTAYVTRRLAEGDLEWKEG